MFLFIQTVLTQAIVRNCYQDQVTHQYADPDGLVLSLKCWCKFNIIDWQHVGVSMVGRQSLIVRIDGLLEGILLSVRKG